MKTLLVRVTGSAWSDAALAAALFVVAEVEVWSGARYQGDPVFPGPRVVTALLVIPLITAPLALRRRAPLATLVVVMGTVTWSSLALGGAEATSFFIVAIVSVYSAAANGVAPAVAIGVPGVAVAVHELRDPHVHGIGDVVWAAGFVVLGWLFGLAVRGRHRRIASLEHETARLEETRDEQARAAVAEERARVARELHDVVAHAVSVVVVQAQAGQRLVGRDDTRTRQSLEAIEETARTALNEMRRLLGMLRDVDAETLEPQPGLASLEALVAHVREAGLPVAVEVDGEPKQLPPGVDLSAYRVVQEGLTNVLKHAGAQSATVTVRYRERSVELEVADDGRGASANGGSRGHGLLGVRERIELYGGEMESGRRPGGGWLLRASLPLHA